MWKLYWIYYDTFLSKQLSVLPKKQVAIEIDPLYLPDPNLQSQL